MATQNTINVRLAKHTGIFYEDFEDGAVIHLHGYDADGTTIKGEDGAIYTPIWEVERTPKVMAAIAEKRLIDVDREPGDRANVLKAISYHRERGTIEARAPEHLMKMLSLEEMVEPEVAPRRGRPPLQKSEKAEG